MRALSLMMSDVEAQAIINGLLATMTSSRTGELEPGMRHPNENRADRVSPVIRRVRPSPIWPQSDLIWN